MLPNAAETKLVLTMNARELLHFFRVRTCRRAQWEIRALAEAMLASRDERFVSPKRQIFDELRGAPDNERVTAETVSLWTARVRRRVRRYGRFKRWL